MPVAKLIPRARNRKQMKQRQIFVKRYIEKWFKSCNKNSAIEQLYKIVQNIDTDSTNWRPDSTLWSKVSTIYCANIYKTKMDQMILELANSQFAIKWIAQYYKHHIGSVTDRILKNKIFL